MVNKVLDIDIVFHVLLSCNWRISIIFPSAWLFPNCLFNDIQSKPRAQNRALQTHKWFITASLKPRAQNRDHQNYPFVAYSRVRLTRMWRALEYVTTKGKCTLESKSCLESVAAPTPRVRLSLARGHELDICLLFNLFNVAFTIYTHYVLVSISDRSWNFFSCVVFHNASRRWID